MLSRPSYPELTAPKPLAGNPNASVLVEEFSDFQCPACVAAEPVVRAILAEYGDRIKFRYAHFPLTQIHRYAWKAAEAAECANDQGRFWDYHNALFEASPALAPARLKEIAARLGLDQARFEACLDSNAARAIVEAEQAEAIRRGAPGTPTFFIAGRRLESWRPDAFKAAIEAALAEG